MINIDQIISDNSEGFEDLRREIDRLGSEEPGRKINLEELYKKHIPEILDEYGILVVSHLVIEYSAKMHEVGV